jgi:hypothetical protein
MGVIGAGMVVGFILEFFIIKKRDSVESLRPMTNLV